MQFPLGMGRPDKAGKGGQTLAVTVGADGGINYDAVVKLGRNRDKVVAATHGAMVPKLDRLTDGVRLYVPFLQLCTSFSVELQLYISQSRIPGF